MKKLFVSFLFGLVTLYGDSLGWSHNYEETLKKAHKENKPVYVLITSQNCRWCRKFENTTLQNKEIQKRLAKEFVVVHLSRETDKIPSQFQTTPVPQHYFTDTEGKILYHSLGYRKTSCFEAFMDNAQEKQETRSP